MSEILSSPTSIAARRDETGLSPDARRTFDTPFDINIIGLWTLYLKEVRRFVKVLSQTLAAPVITTLVFLAIFALALGDTSRHIAGVPYLDFLGPGLIMMTMVQNAFSNTSSSLMIAKIQGNIVDYLVPPLRSGELLTGLVLGGLTRGLMVGAAVAIVMVPFVPLTVHHVLGALFFSVAACLMLSTLGLLAALWSEKFDQIALVTNFIVMPLSFLSGTFYTIHDLPEPFHLFALINPFFYMIDGLRWSTTNHADGSVLVGVAMLTAVNLALLWLALHLLRTGYRLKA